MQQEAPHQIAGEFALRLITYAIRSGQQTRRLYSRVAAHPFEYSPNSRALLGINTHAIVDYIPGDIIRRDVPVGVSTLVTTPFTELGADELRHIVSNPMKRFTIG